MSKTIELRANIKSRQFKDFIFSLLGLLSLLFALVTLLALIVDLAMTGIPRINYEFFTQYPSRFPEKAGILSAWVGSLCIMFTTPFCSIPLGVAAGVYFKEYSKKGFLSQVIELNIINLAGIPSITYGLMALGLFVYKMNLGQSILTAGMTLGLLVLPIIIVTTREAIRTIPNTIREASYAMGASKWQTIRYHILPYSSGGILTGVIIALSRAIGETAPLITIGALTFIAFLPTSPIEGNFPFVNADWLMDPFTVMPIQMFNWLSRPQAAFHENAAATGIVLLVMTLILNGGAIYLRSRFRKRMKW